MLINHQTFYRKFGVRQITQLAAPVATALQYLELPLDSVWHYINYDGSVSGPQNDEFLLRNVKRNVPVFHVDSLTSSVGNPRPIPGTFNAVIKAYHQTHRRTHWLKVPSMAMKDRATPIVYNYALLPKSVRYQQSVYVNYYRWRNIFNTVIDTASQCAEQTGRQQFIFLESPKIIPSVIQLTNAKEGLTQGLLKYFNDTNALVLLDLWKWLTEPIDTTESAFAKIPADKLHLFDFIYQEAGQWFALNLGWLYAWRRPETEADRTYQSKMVDQSKQKLEDEQLAKRLLRLYMAVMELRTITAKLEAQAGQTQELKVVVPQSETAQPVDADDDEPTIDVDDDADLEEVEQTVQEVEADLPTLPTSLPVTDIDALDDNEFAKLLQAEDEAITADLSMLDEIASKQAESLGNSKEEVKSLLEAIEHIDLVDPIVKLCEKLAGDGAISAAEYNRFVRLAESYKHVVSPDGLQTLENFAKIPQESLQLTHPTPMVDTASVVDKSMLASSLNEFDSKYIETVLDKDNANAVLNVQNAGVAVTNYKVSDQEDILGSHQEFVIKLVPIVGVPSTLRFKVPKINEDGTFKSNGVTYRLRKQRGDVPIRKTGPNRVALTSYYGKCFVSRSRTNSNSYNHWLQTQLIAQAIDADNTHITEPMMDDVFDRTLLTPRCYSAIAGKFKGFHCQGYEFNFDHAEVLASWDPAVVKVAETHGSVLLARSASAYLFVDKFGALFEHIAGTVKPLGSLEEFLGLNPADAPVEYASVGVFGKDIPLGFVLGMEMGLQNLVHALGAKYRVVPAGQRIGLQSHEYALSFSDESWVFSRENQLATLILSGFNEYWKSLKLFSVYSFNKRGVYQNLLETNGLGVRYVREIALMYQMFIDPITKDLLIEMKEPTSFKGLLVRAAQLLLSDQHPDELDPAYMRIKGYERISGAIYTELVQSMRAHNAKLGKSNTPIEMNPYAVWKRIMEDPSKTQAQEINPIKQVKETEAVTFAGTGGRNKRSMTKQTRVYHPNDMGTISESTVDSSDVGINIHTSANPQFTSLRGMSRKFDMKRDGPTALLSTSALLAPGSDRDD